MNDSRPKLPSELRARAFFSVASIRILTAMLKSALRLLLISWPLSVSSVAFAQSACPISNPGGCLLDYMSSLNARMGIGLENGIMQFHKMRAGKSVQNGISSGTELSTFLFKCNGPELAWITDTEITSGTSTSVDRAEPRTTDYSASISASSQSSLSQDPPPYVLRVPSNRCAGASCQVDISNDPYKQPPFYGFIKTARGCCGKDHCAAKIAWGLSKTTEYFLRLKRAALSGQPLPAAPEIDDRDFIRATGN